jgi:hypothetical protein
MNLRSIVFIFSFFATQTSLAQDGPQWFQVTMNCSVTQGQVTCTIQNPGIRPMFCRLRADGFFLTGGSLFAELNDWIPSGQYRYVNVYTSPPNPPFVRGIGGGQCHL